ncbi:acyltransferase family protein [uncultured Hyphomicrobium sp.]|uniref:acyltransferase family protein n=1 Tax=uncultured Hyphomicrobium sp. TaxID=194373 RepID=UPI0025FD24A4|nr:acyltransferase family protein [uncultured Hyphomicrobium sp.]
MIRTHTAHASALPYLPHVDGLRALAIALVVIFHAWPSTLTGGFIGVDVFFVISGFIITRQLIADMERGEFSYVAFLGRRVRRLVPAAFVCSLLVSAAAIVVLMPDDLSKYGESLAAMWTMTANFHFYDNSGYFDAPSAEAPLLNMWSLAVEDQFYLTWPLLLLLLVRRVSAPAKIVAAVLALAGLSLLHSEFAARTDPSLAFYLPLSRAFELLAGCALALALPLVAAPRLGVRGVLDAIGLALVAGSAVALHADIPFPGLAVVPTIVGTGLLIFAGLSGPTPVSRLLSLKPVVLAGRMSYSIYLYHWPLLALATYQLGRAPHAGEAALLVLASVALGALSWGLVEQAWTRRAGLAEMAPAGLFKRTAAATVALCLLTTAIVAGEGWPQRLDTPAYKVYSAASQGNPLRGACDGYDQAFAHNDYCTFGRPLAENASYDIAIFGDSNADHFVPMIRKLAENAGYSGRQVTQSACGALIGASRVPRPGDPRPDDETCARYQETILAFLDRNPGLKIAVLSSGWEYYRNLKPNRLSQAGAEANATFAQIAAETIGIFRRRGIDVLIIGQVPFLETFSLRCFADAARRDTEETDCTTPRPAVDATLSFSQAVFKSLDDHDDDVAFLSMADVLCTSSTCSAFKDEVLVYRDRNHLNASGSAYLSRYASLPAIGAAMRR